MYNRMPLSSRERPLTEVQKAERQQADQRNCKILAVDAKRDELALKRLMEMDEWSRNYE